MKYALLSLATLSLGTSAHAQTTFAKYYDHAAGSATMVLSEMDSGNLFAGMAYQSGTSVMDPSGNIIATHCYDLSPFQVLQKVKMYTANEIYFVGGYIYDSCAVQASMESDPVIGRMDSLGNILSVHRYQLNALACANIAHHLEVTTDGGAIATGKDNTFYAIRVDTGGAVLWSRQFHGRGSFSFIHELPSGDLLAGFNTDTTGASIARFNSDGELSWCKSYIRPNGVVHSCIVETDSTFFVVGYTDSIASTSAFDPLPPEYDPKLFLMKIDGMGEVLWCKGYGSIPKWYARRATRIGRTLDSSFVVLANIGRQGYNSEYRPFLMKLDQNGDTIWTRSPGASGYTYTINNLLAASDGGFYFNGLAYGDFGGQSGATYLFKTDNEGLLPCYNRSHPVEVLDLFPVDSAFTLTSVDGAVAYPITIADAFYDPIEVFETCDFHTSVAPSRPSSRGMRVQPNPNTGRFSIQFDDPLQAESWYSVYDALGKLLFQRPLPVGKGTDEVDLSRYGKGTYVIKCTDPTGVYHERVVVE